MDTWKNNNVLSRIKRSYFLKDTDRGRTPEPPAGASLVGGTIFYIDDAAGGTYEFFDTEGNVIENVQVGDRPYAYRVIEKGSKDKYYVYHDELYKGVWTYYKDWGYAYESLDTSTNTGSGKTNTGIVMAKDGGAYITEDSNEYPTIWYQLQQVRNAKASGCDDWFVPSVDEIDKLRLAIKSGSVKGGEIARSSYNESAFMSKFLWSSSEYSSRGAWICCGHQGNHQGRLVNAKDANNSVLFTRAF